MFVRYKVWQDAIIYSQTQAGWESIIVLDYPAIDIRLKLKGYGWRPAESRDLKILYEGQYKCYYRERGSSQWLHFATVISERAQVLEDKVYKDCFAELGVVQSKIYEIKIIATDAEKFKSWGGVLEGISKDQQFWYDLKIRADKPIKIDAADNISVGEYGYGGKNEIILSVIESVSSKDAVTPHLIHRTNLSDEILLSEEYAVYLGISFAESELILIIEDLTIGLMISLNNFEGLFITESVALGII